MLIVLFLYFFPLSSSITVDPNYSFDYKITPTDFQITVVAKNQGWVGIGLGQSMLSAELFVCNYTENNQLKVFHFNSVQEETPHLINPQPVALIEGFRNSTHTSCTFQRNLLANSNNSRDLVVNTPISLIYAYGQADALEYHTERGQMNFTFFACEEFCGVCDPASKKCVSCSFPAVQIDSICQIPKQLANDFSISYYLTDQNSNISITITAQNQGWIGFGFGSSMQGADIYMCNYSQTNSWRVYELKAITEDTPSLDPIQNVNLLQATRNSSHTSCTFKRALKSKGVNNTEILLGQMNNVIYAYGASDNFEYHQSRGSSSVLFQKSFDYNNNKTLCNKGSNNLDCLQCRYKNFEIGLDGLCHENFFKETYQFVNQNVSLYFYIEDNNTMTITMTATNQGYIALGFGSSMFQADILMCHINSTTNSWEAIEFKATKESKPEMDKIQNVLLLSAFRNSTNTVCTFQRNLKTNDSSDVAILLNEKTNMIYALGSTDEFEYHLLRGQFTMEFTNNSQPVCDKLCLDCVANNTCQNCKYPIFTPINGICQEDFDKEILITQNNNFSLFYYLLDTDSIVFTLISNEPGWLGLSFVSNQSNILNELLVCNQTNKNNSWEVVKYYYNNTYFEKASTQDTDLINARRNSTNSICTIKRLLQPNDNQEIPINVSQPLTISYGYDSSDNFQSFKSKGTVEIVISNDNDSSGCDSNICEKCSNDNQACLTCKYINYNLVNGNCLENYAIEKPVTLSQDSNLYYFIDGEEIFFSLIYKSQGWIALGLGSSMVNADIFMCQQSSNGDWKAFEMKSTKEATPMLDPIQNIEFLAGSRNKTHSLCSFRRKIISNDTNDKKIVLNALNSVIFAIGSSDTFAYHIERGTSSINFTNSTLPSICPQNCLKCDNNNQCIKCVDPSFVVLNGACQANDLVVLPSSATIMENQLYLFWNFTEDNQSVEIMIKTSNQGYISLGIGDCMDNCDIHVAQYDQNGNIKLLDMYSNSQSFPSNDVDLGGTNNLILLGYGEIDGFMYIKYSRKIETGDKWDFSLNQGDHEMAYAFSSGKTLEFHHNNKGKFKIHFVQGYNGGVDMEDSNKLARLHGILLFVAWGGLIDIALVFGRYLKTFRWYIEVHSITMFMVCILSIVMESLLIYKNRQDIPNLDQEEPLIYAHFIIGVIILGLCLVEVFLGFIVHLIIEKKEKFIDNRKIKLTHQINGILIYLLSKANIGIGIKIFKENLLIPLIIFYVLLFALKAIIEILYNLELKVFKREPTILKNMGLLHSDLVTKINQNTSREALLHEFTNLKWVILDTQIYDISNFKHPGGNYIIEQIKGREIGRFFYGISGLENLTLPAHKHSLYALNFLNSRLIGKIENQKNQALIKKNNLSRGENSTWKVFKKKELSQTTSIFTFKTLDFSVKNYIPGVEWMGKHFTVQAVDQGNKLTRLYTTVLCFSHQNIKFREALMVYYERLKKGNSTYSSEEEKENESVFTKSSDLDLGFDISLESEELTLVIKNYNHPKAFSTFIHNNTEIQYFIRGNFGNGLELSKYSSGSHYIFAGGTGILPFMDLLEYLLKKAIFTPNKENEKALSPSFNIYKEDYVGTFNNNFKITLFGSFKNDDEFIGSDIVVNLYEIVKAKKLGFFDMKIRLSEKETNFEKIPLISGYFDSKFIKENISNDENMKKIYVCGPPTMQKKLFDDLQKCKIEENKIHFV